MSGRQAKADRRAHAAAVERDRLAEFIAQAHDRLHKDDTDACHDLLHRAMGTGEVPGEVAPLLGLAEFDKAFRDLCIGAGVRASYVLGVPQADGLRLVSGGDAELDAIVTRGVRATQP